MMSDTQMPPLFFLHNPKAGGSSVRDLLQSGYSARETSPVIENSPQDYRNVAKQYAQFRGYRFYSGHYGYCVFRAVADGHILITNFRNPVSRIFSLYNFWRNNVPDDVVAAMPEADAAPVREAKTKSFSDFIRSENPSLRLYIDNAHYRQIWDTWYVGSAGSRIGFVRVLRRIAGMRWFYIAEFPALSRSTLVTAFPQLQSAKIPTINETLGKQTEDCVSGSDAVFLLTKNRRDFAIYIFALALLGWRICRQGAA